MLSRIKNIELVILFLFIGCATIQPTETHYKIVNGIKLHKQQPDTIRVHNMIITNNYHNAKVFLDTTYSISRQ